MAVVGRPCATASTQKSWFIFSPFLKNGSLFPTQLMESLPEGISSPEPRACSSLRTRPHSRHGPRDSPSVSPGLPQPLRRALAPFPRAAFLKHTLQSFPKVPLVSPSLPECSPTAAAGQRWGALGGGVQTSGLAGRVSPLWAATQSSGKPSLENTEADFAEGGSWTGMAMKGKVRCWLLLGAFPPHMSVSLSNYKLTHQDSPKHSSLHVNNIPACPCIVPIMKHMLWNWGKSLDWLFFSTVLPQTQGALLCSPSEGLHSGLCSLVVTPEIYLEGLTEKQKPQALLQQKPTLPDSVPRCLIFPGRTDFVWNDC